MPRRKFLTTPVSFFLLTFGLLGLFYSLFSPALVIGGLSILIVILGILILWLVRRSPLRAGNAFKAVMGVTVLATFFSGCTIKVPMSPDVGKIEIPQQVPFEAALLITEEAKQYIFRGHPHSFTASARPHEFPLGEALEKASMDTFSQIFPKVTLVRSSQEAKKFPLMIEPTIEDFHFEYDQASYLGFAVSVLSRMRVKVTLASGETKIWEKSVQTPDYKEGPWVMNFSYEEEVGKSASRALVFALRNIAAEIAADQSIRQFLNKQKVGSG